MVFWSLCPIAALPLIFYPQILGGLGKSWAVAGLFLGTTLYAFMNYTAYSAWMPILRENLPRHRAAEFVGLINAVSLGVACCATFGFSFLFGKQARIEVFQMLFVVAVVLAGLRAWFVRRVRDMAPQPLEETQNLRHDLGKIWRNVRFRRLMIFVAMSLFGVGITIPFRAHYIIDLGHSDWFAAIATVTVILGLYGLASWGWGRLADRYGSRGVYILGGSGVVLGHLIMLLPWNSSYLSGVLILLGLGMNAASWAGLESGNIRRLFTIVPRKNQSLYMVCHLMATNIFLAIGNFVGGVLLTLFRRVLPAMLGEDALPPAAEYRALFLVAAGILALSVLYSRTMGRLKEVSTPRMLLHLRLRTQRRLTSGLAATFLRFRPRKRNDQ